MRKPPGDSFHEEPNKKRELRAAWDELAAKHLLPKIGGTKHLATLLRLTLMLESHDPKFQRDIPPDKFPKVLEIASLFWRLVHLAYRTLDLGLLRRLLDAGKLVAECEGAVDLNKFTKKFTLTDYGLVAWAYLYGELGHLPSKQQVEERVEQFRKEDGQTERMSGREWDRMWAELRPLFRLRRT